MIWDGNACLPLATRLLEDTYDFQDMLQVALIINTFIRRSNVVRIAAIAQSANVKALSMTQPDGPA